MAVFTGGKSRSEENLSSDNESGLPTKKRGRGRPRRNPELASVVKIGDTDDMRVGSSEGSGPEVKVDNSMAEILGQVVAREFKKHEKKILKGAKELEIKERQAREDTEKRMKLYGQAVMMAEDGGDIDKTLIDGLLDKYIKGSRDRKFLGIGSDSTDHEPGSQVDSQVESRGVKDDGDEEL